MPWYEAEVLTAVRRSRQEISGGFVGVFLLVSLTADASGKRASWQLINARQKACVNVTNPYSDYTSYYGIWVKGSWRASLNAGLENAPAGSTIWGSSLPIPPGSSDGVGSLAYGQSADLT
jgi:hypothetical protein